MTGLKNDEYVVLFPISRPITSLEIDNELYVLYEDLEFDLQKLSKVSSNGVILWTKDLSINVTNHYLNFMTNDDNQLYLFNNSGLGNFDKVQFDLEGNITEVSLLSNESFDDVHINQNNFYLIKHNSTGIYFEKYSSSGNLLETSNVNISIEEPDKSKTIINNKSYLFGLSDFNGSALDFYDNYFCEIYENNSLLNSIKINISNSSAHFRESLVLDNGNILFITKTPEDTEFKLFDSSTGDNIANKTFEGIHNGDYSIFLMTDGNLGFVSHTSINDKNTKLSQFTILDSNLNTISQRFFGSYEFGEIRYDTHESRDGNYYYITGRTNGIDGDYTGVPNNSDTIDMFLFKLSK